MAASRPVRRAVLSLLLCAVSLSSWWGCSSPDRNNRPAGLADLSPAVAAARDLTRAWLAGDQEGGTADGLFRRTRLWRADLSDPATRGAVQDSFYLAWGQDPANPAYIELALQEARHFKRDPRWTELLEKAAGPDSAAAIFHFVQGRGASLRDLDRAREELEGAVVSLAAAEKGNPALEFLARRRLAYLERKAGQEAVALDHLLGLLPLAWSTGGAELVALVWYDINNTALEAGRLGDALAAISLAQRCAEINDDQGLLTRARIGEGRVLQERGQFALADSVFAFCLDQARAQDNRQAARQAIGRRVALAALVGDLAGQRRHFQTGFELDAAARDTAYMIIDAAAVGDALRREGRLAEAEEWFGRGYELAGAYSRRGYGYMVDNFRAMLLSQLGRYAEAETLLVRYAASPGARRNTLSAFGVQMTLLEQGMETNRPDLAYRALGRAEELLDSTSATVSYDPALNLRMKAAKLHARQGEFHLADGDLQAMEKHLADATSEGRFYAEEARAQVAVLTGDQESATVRWRRCVALADSLGAPDLQSRSRVGLAASLMAGGNPEEAATLVAGDLDAPEYWTRLNATLITGLSLVRTGEPARALEIFGQAETLLGSDPPADLAARLSLEKGKALAQRGQDRQALVSLRAARTILERGRGGSGTDVGRSFNASIVQETAEALLSLLSRKPGLAGSDVAGHTRHLAAWGRGQQPSTWPGPALEFFVGREEAFVWSGSGSGEWRWRALPAAPELARLVLAVTVDTGYPGRPVDQEALRALGEALLQDLPGDPGRTLGLVPHGELHTVPWAALPVPAGSGSGGGPGECLLERGPLAMITGVSGAEELRPGQEPEGEARQYDAPVGGRLLVLASDRAGEDEEPLLRHAEAEARAVARLWPPDRVTLRLGPQGDLRQLLAGGLAGWRAIHISSHTSVYEGVDGSSAIHLAGTNGVLTLPELAAARVGADLVFLSSCEGGRRHQAAGQGVTSFAQAFQQAGARSVIASLVLVEDEAAVQVARAFYRGWQGGMERAAALRAALLELREKDPRWSHPFYWGYYQLYADQ